jgi:hypothetical protein
MATKAGSAPDPEVYVLLSLPSLSFQGRKDGMDPHRQSGSDIRGLDGTGGGDSPSERGPRADQRQGRRIRWWEARIRRQSKQWRMDPMASGPEPARLGCPMAQHQHDPRSFDGSVTNGGRRGRSGGCGGGGGGADSVTVAEDGRDRVGGERPGAGVDR